jgi:hypothetical protein
LEADKEMNEKQFKKLVKSIQSSMRCHVCGNSYTAADIRYLGQLDVMVFLRLRCEHCKAQALATITTDQNTAIYDNWDLEEQAEKEASIELDPEPPVTFNDVLDLHTDLDKAGSNFKEWLKSLK